MASVNVVAHNLQGIFTNRQLGITNNNRAKSSEKLSSGYKINRAADDAAGLSISEKMRRQIRGLSQGTENAQDGVSMCQTADGALAEVGDMLHRITELSVKSANGTNSPSDRQDIQAEINEILQEIDRVSNTTKFNEEYLFSISEMTPPTYDEAKDWLLNASYPLFSRNVTLSNGQSLSKDDTNALISFLSNMAITSDLWNKSNVDMENADYLMEKKIPALIHNSQVFYQSKYPETVFAELMKNAEKWLTSNPDNPNYRMAWYGYSNVLSGFTEGMPKFAASIMYNATLRPQSQSHSSETNCYIANSHLSVAEVKYLFDSAGITGSETYDICKESWSESTAPVYGWRGDHIDTAVRTYMSLFNEEKEDKKKWWIQSGADNSDDNGMYLEIGKMDTEVLGIRDLNASTLEGARDAIGRMEPALLKLNNIRSKIGAQQNRLEHTIKNQLNVIENTQASESLIRDADMADEMVKYSKEGILQQAGQAMLSQANQSNQGVLSILQ